jgi:hypothetical protein
MKNKDIITHHLPISLMHLLRPNHPRCDLHVSCDGIFWLQPLIEPAAPPQSKATASVISHLKWPPQICCHLIKRDRWSGLVVMVMDEFSCVRERRWVVSDVSYSIPNTNTFL